MRVTLRNRVEFSTPTANSVSFAVYVLNHVAANRAFIFNDSSVSNPAVTKRLKQSFKVIFGPTSG